MNDSFDLTPQTAESLQMRLQSLATLLAQTAEALQQGEPVELQHVSNEIAAVQDQIGQVSRQLQQHPLLADSERQVSRSGEIVNACREIVDRQKAVDQLKRLQLVKSFEPADQETFRHMLDQVNAKIHSLTSGSAEERKQTVYSITEHNSPFRGLYELINRPEELSDERWLENQRLLTEAFGRNVAVAVLRGRAR